MGEIVRGAGRLIVHAWLRSELAPGYAYQIIDRYGASLDESSTFSRRLPNGCEVNCKLGDHVERQIYFYGAYEPTEAYVFSRLLKPGQIFVDAGANVGQYSLLAATAVGVGGQVHSFEPVPGTFEKLKAHVARNGLLNVRLNNCALWNKSDTIRLGLPVDKGGNAGSFSVSAAGASGAITARALTLDEYAASNGVRRVDVIKMDIEGAEPFALEGARGVLERDHPLILIELNRKALTDVNSSPEAVVETLFSMGYKAWRIGHSAATSGRVEDVSAVEQANFLFHQSDLPETVLNGWTLRDALRWARTGSDERF